MRHRRAAVEDRWGKTDFVAELVKVYADKRAPSWAKFLNLDRIADDKRPKLIANIAKEVKAPGDRLTSVSPANLKRTGASHIVPGCR
jgi:hypothetical protein